MIGPPRFADTNNHRIRLVSPNGNIVTVAGIGQAYFPGTAHQRGTPL